MKHGRRTIKFERSVSDLVRRSMKDSKSLLVMSLAVFALSACGIGSDGEADDQSADEIIAATNDRQTENIVAEGVNGVTEVEGEYGTPMAQRVATIGFLNKRNNESRDLQMKPGEARRIGNVVIRLEACERTAPWESPAESGAFVQVLVQDKKRRNSSTEPKWQRIFSGWLFKESPSINVVEHPIYDVWVKNCAMRFPGEEEVTGESDEAVADSDAGSGRSGDDQPIAEDRESTPRNAANDRGNEGSNIAPPPAPSVAPPSPPEPAAPEPTIEDLLDDVDAGGTPGN